MFRRSPFRNGWLAMDNAKTKNKVKSKDLFDLGYNDAQTKTTSNVVGSLGFYQIKDYKAGVEAYYKDQIHQIKTETQNKIKKKINNSKYGPDKLNKYARL